MAPKPRYVPSLLIATKTRPLEGSPKHCFAQSESFGLPKLDLVLRPLPSKHRVLRGAVERPRICIVPLRALRKNHVDLEPLSELMEDFMGHLLAKNLVSSSLIAPLDFHYYHYFQFNSHSQRGNLSWSVELLSIKLVKTRHLRVNFHHSKHLVQTHVGISLSQNY